MVENLEEYKRKKFFEEKEEVIGAILNTIANIDNIPEHESYMVDTLKGIKELELHLNRIVESKYLILQNRPGSDCRDVTHIIVENKVRLAECIIDLVSNKFKNGWKFRFAKLVFPLGIQFYKEGEEDKALYPHDCQLATVICD